MDIVSKARMIALEAAQLADNVERWAKASQITYVNIGDGGSLSAIVNDIVKIRRDLLNLRDSLPESAYGSLDGDV